MLAAIRMEVMTPSTDSPDEGCIGCYLVVLFSMWFVVLLWWFILWFLFGSYWVPYASNLFSDCSSWKTSRSCSRYFKAFVWYYFKVCFGLIFLFIFSLSHWASNTMFLLKVFLFCSSSGMIDLKELCLVSGKAAWMGYLVSTRWSYIGACPSVDSHLFF